MTEEVNVCCLSVSNPVTCNYLCMKGVSEKKKKAIYLFRGIYMLRELLSGEFIWFRD